ncbi:uncharacterized protein J7T54_007014 [Emericellopsis cladophorae]|uniref:Uncharacterized protein n=1 Tax=Emericellopsis cladophorae TaxID=2686198 RepID=A0A9Q0BGU4_9HYPO|nr:uncharacterized protein J7T54_007014 [Emericellopsis cladophorae]KAI6785372.1 hypothetical protein J7T54_007014 [Emericellopsis cladophorae]
MFGGFAPPQQSREEIQAMEAEAVFTVQQVAATAFLLYMCKQALNCVTLHPSHKSTAPFAIDMVSKIF